MHRPLHTGAHAFFSRLDAGERQHLFDLRNTAVQAPPADWFPWWCGTLALGTLAPERAHWLQRHLVGTAFSESGLVWDAESLSREARSASLQSTLEAAGEQGLLTGWRNERFSYWRADFTTPDPGRAALLDVERAGFRFLGMMSHAVHVNGFLPDGRLWIARRSASKATDPGMLDNVTAGGLPTGETITQCLARELAEEAGVNGLENIGLQAAGFIRTSRLEKEGWHDECLHTFNLTLPADFEPRNVDGEVSEFMCLTPQETMQTIAVGKMTADAVMTLVQGLDHANIIQQSVPRSP